MSSSRASQYLTLGWYKTPQLRSNTAQTIFGGVGSTNLTVPNSVAQALYGGLFPFGSARPAPALTIPPVISRDHL